MPKFAANLSWLYQDLPFLERFKAATESGFKAVEFLFPYPFGFLAKRLLLRGGRLLKHIGVAAVVAAPEISGCGFPAQVAVNALIIDVKLSGHVSAYLFAMSAMEGCPVEAIGNNGEA